MNSRKEVYRQTAVIAIGHLLCGAAMVGIFAALGYFDITVLSGAVAGIVIATANFFIMGLCADIAADKATNQDVTGAQKLIQLSYAGRMIGILLILILLGVTGWCHALALVLPLAFNRPILTVYELLHRKGGVN